MSEEEIMKNLKKIIDSDNCWLEDKESADEDMIEWAELEKSAIQGLLDLYQKEKEKNKNARERIEYYLVANMRLNDFDERNKELRKLEKILEE